MVNPVGGSGFQLRPPQELPGIGGAGAARGPQAAGPAAGSAGGFGDDLKKFLGGVNDLQTQSNQLFEGFVRGEVTDLHQVAIAQQEAGIALKLTVEMRDRLLQSYQEVMRMTL